MPNVEVARIWHGQGDFHPVETFPSIRAARENLAFAIYDAVDHLSSASYDVRLVLADGTVKPLSNNRQGYAIAGVMGVGTSIPYAASKGALNTLTLSLARWFGPAVRVNTVCPGFSQTRWLLGALGEENYEKLKQAQEQTTPLRQAGTPEQMAEAAIFFLTSASNITGEFLIVDAGTHLGGLPMKGR
mgnify:CR=1 FL=1